MLTAARRAEQVAALRAVDLERLHVAAEAARKRASRTRAVLAQLKRGANTERQQQHENVVF